MAYTLGIDLGSSSVKVCLADLATGRTVAHATTPEVEMPILSPTPGWAEQSPEHWWNYVVAGVQKVRAQAGIPAHAIEAIGLAYQMHGLVLVDKAHQVLRPAIIWCDSRAVAVGEQAQQVLGDYCHRHLLNAPGNFTAARLAWVHQHEPDLFEKIHKALLPGDYIALRMTGEESTTYSGLSEGIFWDFRQGHISARLLQTLGLSRSLLPDLIFPSFGLQGKLTEAAASAMGLRAGTPVTYRAGDQPNNALSVGALQPGETAATAGTSGVIYAVTDQLVADLHDRVNTFLHVNHQHDIPRLGMLLCINGTGILYRWLRDRLRPEGGYEEMNRLASQVAIGAEGLTVMPFGNGSERLLQQRAPGAAFLGLDFNRHGDAHLARAAQEGIVFAMAHGFSVLENLGLPSHLIRAGHANLFKSALFAEAFANTLNVRLELVNTEGAWGAAMGAAMGAGLLPGDAVRALPIAHIVEPRPQTHEQYRDLYQQWVRQMTPYLGLPGRAPHP